MKTFAVQIKAGSDGGWVTVFSGNGLEAYRERLALAKNYPTLDTRGVRVS